MSLKGLIINTPPEMEAHIGAQDDRSIWESIFGTDAVLDAGNKLNAVLVSNNQLRIYDGVLVAGGAIGRIPFGEYEDVVIENGTQGERRNDLVIAEIRANTSVEEMKITYVKGTPGQTAVDPEYTTGNVYEGDTVRQYPIYRVRLNGLNVEGVDCLFEVLPNIAGVKNEIAELNSNLNNVVIDIDSYLQPANDILITALTTQHMFSLISSGQFTTNVPDDNYRYTLGLVLKRTSDQITIILFGRENGIATNRWNGTRWSGWKIR